MPNLRYSVRLIKAFLLRFRGILILSTLLGIGLFLLLRFALPKILVTGPEKIAIIGRYNTTNLPTSILNLVGNGLTKLDHTGAVVPALAKSWESTDGKTWKFTLDENARWQDGTPVTSQTINYSFEDVQVEKPDSQTLLFHLESPFSPFPTVVSKTVFKRGLLGTGEWEVKRVSLANSVVQEILVERTDGRSRLYHFYPTEDQAKLAYKMGEVNIIEEVIDPMPLDSWNNTVIEKQDNLKRFVAIFFNTKDDKLAEKRVRQALFYAINKDRFNFVRAENPLSPNSWGYNPETKPYDCDVAKARELLSGLGFNEIRLAATPVLLKTAESVAQDWAAVGVKTTVSVSSVVPDEYQAYMVMYDIPPDPDQYATWHSTQLETNISNYKNIRVDKLLEDGRQELDFEDRKRIYLDFQRFLLEDAPAAFLYHPASYTIKRK